MKAMLSALLLALAACSTTSNMRDAQPTPPPGPDEAKVIVYRTAALGGADNFPVYKVEENDGKLLGFTETDCYFEVRCAPGKHRFAALGEGEAFVDADLAAGKTYYIRAYSKFGLLSSRPGFAPVGRGSEHYPELDEVLPKLRCRELDPGKRAELEAREEKRLKKALAREAEARELRPDDGKESGPTLPAK